MFPVIVIGPPRSGTSVVARLLHEQCGIKMITSQPIWDQNNPGGDYEDPLLYAITENRLRRWKHGAHSELKFDPFWTLQFSTYVKDRQEKDIRWGFKEPRVMGFFNQVLQFFDDPTIIETFRYDEQIIKSQVEKLKFPYHIAVAGLNAYKDLLIKYLDGLNVYPIDLSKKVSEKTLINHLKGIVKWQ